MTDTPKKVLIHRLGSLGDTAIMLPVFHHLNRIWPQAEKRMLTNFPVASAAAPAQAVLGEGTFVSEYFSYPLGTRNIGALRNLAADIRRWKPDIAIYANEVKSLSSAWRDGAFLKYCGVGRIFGLPVTAKRRKHLSDAGTGVFEREASRIARALAPIGTIDISDPSGWNLALTQPEEDAAGSALAGWDGAENFICFSPGTKQPINNWPDPQWISVLETVSAAHPDLGAAVIGASDDRERGSTLLNAWRGPTLNCCGEISPRASAALMQRARLFLGHDSGPMHLAAAVQTPVVAVFSRRNPPGIWFPFGDDHRIFYPGLAWSGGHPAVTRTADGETDIASIPAEQVAAACCVNLAQAGRPAA